MREIKFRGKSINKGEWLFGDLVHDNIGGSYIFPIEAENLYKENAVIPETVGQYTGLTDKNGKEIYEGDIMNDPTDMGVGVVEWNSILCQFQLSWKNMHIAADIFFMVKCGSFVIGNIHDNHEYLKILNKEWYKRLELEQANNNT